MPPFQKSCFLGSGRYDLTQVIKSVLTNNSTKQLCYQQRCSKKNKNHNSMSMISVEYANLNLIMRKDQTNKNQGIFLQNNGVSEAT